MTIKLYYMPESPPCRAVQMVAATIGLPLDLCYLDLSKGEHYNPDFQAINPQRVVPTMVDGDFVLWESRAIMAYLVDKYSPGSQLYPKEPCLRAKVDQMLYFDIGTLYKHQGTYLIPLLHSKPLNPDDEKPFITSLEHLDSFLESTSSFVCGNDLTIADISLIASLSFAEAADYDFSKYKFIQGWREKVQSLFLLTDDTTAGGEMLPQNWNRDQTGYVLRYVKGDPGSKRRKLVVKAVPMGNMLLCTFLENPGEKTAELSLTPEFLTQDYRDYSKAFAQPNSVETLKNEFEKRVISHLDKPSSQPPSPSENRRSTPSANAPPQPRVQPPRYAPPDWDQDLSHPMRGPPRVGGADLDPFNRGVGGGMLMDPRELYGNSGRYRPPGPGMGPFGGGPRLPPGSIPPGARFDPFGPPHPGPRPGPRGPRPRGPNAGNPDPDHEMPPDYDDMFM